MNARRWAGRVILFLILTLIGGACNSSHSPGDTPTSTDHPPQVEADLAPDATRWGYPLAFATGEQDEPPFFMNLPSDYFVETYATGLELPTSLAFLPDGRLLVGEQTGTIRTIENGELRGEPYFVAPVYKPDDALELGLVGMTVDPEFETNRHVYIYYTTAEPVRRTVLARIRDEDGAGTDVEEVLSFELDPSCCHIAGGLQFADDGTLFVAVGDHQYERSSQNRLNPFGSILRIDRNGDAPLDNPFVGDGDPRIYAYGLRNPFGLTIDPNGRIFSTENGYIGQDAILEIVPGANYGWPGVDLDVPMEDVEPPLAFFHESIGPAGIDFYSDDQLPALTDSLLFCQYHGRVLRSMSFSANGSLEEDGIVAPGCTSAVLTGPDGLIYFLDIFAGTVSRVTRGPS